MWRHGKRGASFSLNTTDRIPSDLPARQIVCLFRNDTTKGQPGPFRPCRLDPSSRKYPNGPKISDIRSKLETKSARIWPAHIWWTSDPEESRVRNVTNDDTICEGRRSILSFGETKMYTRGVCFCFFEIYFFMFWGVARRWSRFAEANLVGEKGLAAMYVFYSVVTWYAR